MTASLLLIENQAADSPNAPEAVARIFGASHWIVAGSVGDRFKPRRAVGVENCPGLGEWGDLFDFLDLMAERYDVVIRVRSPDYPLHPGLAREMAEEFPLDRYDHVVSTGEECGLAGYFAERLTPGAIRRARARRPGVTAPGYLNLVGTEGSGRHWFSLALRRFYYEDHFETLFDSPRSVSINLQGGCNYTCLKCQYHSSALPGKRDYPGTMDMERFAWLLDRLSEYKRLAAIYPTITGEPLMHPRIVEVVEMIKRAGYACAFTTNASLLTPEMSERLLDSGLDGLAFSVDTLDPEKYRRLQHGGDLAVVERNILAYRDAVIRRNGSVSAVINCVVGPENEDEQDAFRAYWLERGLTVQLSTQYDIFNDNTPHFDLLGWGPSHRMPCSALWFGMYLTDQGRLVSCGSMAKTLGIKDSLFDMSPHELWRCKAMQSLRAQQLTGAKPGYCKEFNCWTGMMTTHAGESGNLRAMSRSAVSHIPEGPRPA